MKHKVTLEFMVNLPKGRNDKEVLIHEISAGVVHRSGYVSESLKMKVEEVEEESKLG